MVMRLSKNLSSCLSQTKDQMVTRKRNGNVTVLNVDMQRAHKVSLIVQVATDIYIFDSLLLLTGC